MAGMGALAAEPPDPRSAGFVAALLAGAVGAVFAAQALVGDWLLAANLAILCILAACAAAERLWSYSVAWRPSARDMRTDLFFLAAVQAVLPLMVTTAVAALAARAGAPALRGIAGMAVAAQVAVLVLAFDLVQYWFHRAIHQVPALWRFHALHHRPRKLYALNAARAHPVEKLIQATLSSLALLPLGPSTEALAVAIALAAAFDTLQHSNLPLRLGGLNLFLMGPELHRRHHSIVPATSNSNFGRLSPWPDLLFGTYKPPAAELDPLGVA